MEEGVTMEQFMKQVIGGALISANVIRLTVEAMFGDNSSAAKIARQAKLMDVTNDIDAWRKGA
jgi:hypothetical protein